MNSKHKKYKEYLKLNRERDKLEERYKSITGGSYLTYGDGAIDYTQIKEIIPIESNNKIHYTQWEYNNPTKELLELNLLDNIVDIYNPNKNQQYSILRWYNGKTSFESKFNQQSLKNVKVPKEYYDNLPDNLKSYFYKKVDVWKSFNNEHNYYFDYLFKYDILIHKKKNGCYIERYYILSDIQKQYDYLSNKITELGIYCGFWGTRLGKHWKKYSHRNSRAALKRTLNKAIREDNYDLCSHKEHYHNPHSDRWIWD